jgi:hypothetical protein
MARRSVRTNPPIVRGFARHWRPRSPLVSGFFIGVPMAKQIILDNPIYQAIDGNGQPLAGGFLEPYVAGTSTPAVLYQDVNGRVPHPARIPLNARGEAVLYGNGRYKFKLLDAAGGLIHTVDDIEIVVISDWALNFLKLRTLREAVRYFGFGTAAYEDIAASILAPQPGDVLQMGPDGWYPAGDGRLITNLQPGNITGLIHATTPTKYLEGLTLAKAGANLRVSAGWCKSDDDTSAIRLATTTTKTLSAWVAGDGNGGLDESEAQPDQWYFVYAIYNPTSGVSDVLLSRDQTDETINFPEGYTKKRRIGAVYLADDSGIRPFFQHGDDFYWVSLEMDSFTINSAQTLISLDVPPLQVKAFFHASGGESTFCNIYFRSPDTEDQEVPRATSMVAPLYNLPVHVERAHSNDVPVSLQIETNASGQIYARRDNAAASTVIYLCTVGWTDRRGKD